MAKAALISEPTSSWGSGELPESVDLIVVGSGAAGLMAACTVADRMQCVMVIEGTDLIGGTAAVSGGMVWVPCNAHMAGLGVADSREEAFEYLQALSVGEVPDALIRAFVDGSSEMLRYLESNTRARFTAVMRPDYLPGLPGSKPGGRSLDNRPFSAAHLAGVPIRSRERLPIIHEERRLMRRRLGAETIDRDVLNSRKEKCEWTLGSALAGALITACIERKVVFATGTRLLELLRTNDGVVCGVRASVRGEDKSVMAEHGVILATGGFEWSEQFRNAFLPGPDHFPVSPPINRGEGLVAGLAIGAAIGSMTEAWWVPATRVPGETEESFPRSRHLSDELALPGSILVNTAGRRFVNEATNYNDLSRAFAEFDPLTYKYPNARAWLIFDETYRQRYMVAGESPAEPAPSWWASAPDLRSLARAIQIDGAALERSVEEFNSDARTGVDRSFGRGQNRHDRYYGDDAINPNPCLAPLEVGPFFAVQVQRGSFGTKGGIKTDEQAQVIDRSGESIAGLWACGNVSSAVTGPGYPGAGATLSSALTFGYIAGVSATKRGLGSVS